MSIEEIYESELFKELLKNRAFSSKFYEVMRRATYYVKEENLNINIVKDKLIVSYSTPIQERELNCQCLSEVRYEFSVNSNGNLYLDEKFGTIRSNYGYDFLESKGGMVDTEYSCSMYEPDGVELAFQSYSDSYTIKPYAFETVKKEFATMINTAYNPNLVYFNEYDEFYPKPGIIGDLPRYIRRTRSKYGLGIVDSIECIYNNEATLSDFRHELYYNTFIEHQGTFYPESISVIVGDPFAVIDQNGITHINRRHLAQGLTNENYREKANERFIKELQNDRSHLKTEDIEARYDLMICKLLNEKQYKKNI